jgi:hypothetical protein
MPSGTLKTDRETCQLYVLDATRVHQDWFIEMALEGDRSCTITVHAPVDAQHALTVHRALAAVGTWLLSGDRREHAFLEVPGLVERPS